MNLPFAVLFPDGWREFFRLNSTRQADHDSIYNALHVLKGWQGIDGPVWGAQPPHNMNLLTLGLFALVCLAVAVIGLTAPHRPRVASLAFLIVAGFLLTNKVWSPQYSLWLVPLAVLALPRWIPLLAWMSVDAYVWYPRMGYFLGLATGEERGNSPAVFLHAVVVRDVLVTILCALVVWTIYAPSWDSVRRDGVDDPAGGPLDGTPTGRTRWRDLRPFGERVTESPPDARSAAADESTAADRVP